MAEKNKTTAESASKPFDWTQKSKLKKLDPYHYPSYSEYLFMMKKLREKHDKMKELGLDPEKDKNSDEDPEEMSEEMRNHLANMPTIENSNGIFYHPDKVKMDLSESKKMRRKERRKLKKTVAETLKEKAAQSSAHGICSVVTEPNVFVKVVWLICMLASYAYFSYQTLNILIQFNSYEVSSDVGIVYEAPTIFPAIDICNLNPYDGYESGSLMAQILAAKNITMQDSSSALEYTEDISEQIKSSFEQYELNSQLDLYDSSFYLGQMLISCMYHGKECSINDFFPYHDHDYGNCFRFNGLDSAVTNQEYSFSPPSSLRKTTKPGWENGLRLELYVGDPDKQVQYAFKRGMRVIIHNQTIVPFPSEDGIDISTGQQTNIGITRTFIERLPYPYSDCIDELDEEAANRNKYIETMYDLKTKGILMRYQQLFCLKICYQEYIINKCGCYDSSLAFLNVSNGSPGCFNTLQVRCQGDEEDNFYNSEEVTECYTYCPIECKVSIYSTEISVAAYPTTWYSQLFNQSLNSFVNYSTVYLEQPSHELLEKSQLMVNIFYDEMTYYNILEEPVLTFEDLLANIGGNMGLFTGMSILSLMEFFEMIVLASVLFSRYYKARRD